MRLSAADGSFFELDIAGYQFPEDVESPLQEYDLNWLLVHIRARTSAGLEWQATDPCLLAWELEELTRWLEVHSYDDKAFPTLDFVEPGLSFDVRHQGRDSNTSILQFRLSCELAPPVPDGTRRADLVLRFGVSDEGLVIPARECRALCTRFPRRPAVPVQEGNA